jgi:hypothetical protein
MEHQNLLELAALYALDALDANEQALFERHLAESPELETEVAAFAAVVSALAYGVPIVAIAPDLKDRLLQCISGEPTSHSLMQLRHQAEQVDWQPYSLAASTMIGKLCADPNTRELQCFVRAWTSTQFPRHRHAADEEIVVLEGDLMIAGRVYGEGDRIHSQRHTIHQPETLNGCLLFVRTSQDDEILDIT